MAAGRSLKRVLHGRDGGELGEAAEQGRVGLGLALENGGDIVEEAVDDGRGLGGFGRERGRRERGLALLLRIGVAEGVGQSLGREAGHETMLFAREDPDLEPLALGEMGVEILADPDVLLGRDAAGPAVGDEAVPDRGEIAAGDEIVPADLDPRAQGLEDAPAELILQGVIAKEGQVRRAAARGDAHHDRIGHAADSSPWPARRGSACGPPRARSGRRRATPRRRP